MAHDDRQDISRRGFLAGLGALLAIAAGFITFSIRRRPPAALIGPAVDRGHALRQPLSSPGGKASANFETVIIGGGISGLSAAWYLQKHGYRNFRLFELENRTGGNAQWGENRIGRYPWGAHYLPTPGNDAVYVRELLTEMGVLKERKFSEEVLVHEPEERLYIYGTWQTGLVPWFGAREKDREEMQRFLLSMADLKKARGNDGRRAFNIPLALSSRDERFTRFDKISAAAYLAGHNFSSQRLAWYIDYVLRDEYGSNRHNTSAWAMLHYFAARSDAHNLVWPEGNGRIAEYLQNTLLERIQPATAVRLIEKTASGYHLQLTDFQKQSTIAVMAKNVIFAAPKFVLPYVYPALPAEVKANVAAYVYSPWLTVNLLVNHFAPHEPAWDNVSYGSKSLGYVVAEHQKPGKLPHARTLTFFHAFDDDDTLMSRRHLLSLSAYDAAEFALTELRRPHPDIAENVEDIGIYRWAHAMIRPQPGFLSARMAADHTTIDTQFYAAHSDVSGMSNFEEAQYRGIEAARRILSK